jgi:hypothetical protein
MHNVGGVIRGKDALGSTNIWPDTIYYEYGPVTLTWKYKQSVSIRFYRNIGDDTPIHEFDTNTNRIKADSLFRLLSDTGSYYWAIGTSKITNPRRFYLRVMSREAYQKSVSKILAGIIKTTPAEAAFMAGFQLEKAGFPADAGRYYQKALSLEPQNKLYRQSSLRFNNNKQ